jgi:mannosyl-oligosaccharide alpha-1,2-mannosidase
MWAPLGTGIGPEAFRFTNESEAITQNEGEQFYILRPEVIEGWFYLWRTTKDPKYRDWCWDAAQVCGVRFVLRSNQHNVDT